MGEIGGYIPIAYYARSMYNGCMMKIRKNFNLSRAVVAAMKTLQKKGYAFPASTEVGVVEQAIRDAWEKEYPDKLFPQDDNRGERE